MQAWCKCDGIDERGEVAVHNIQPETFVMLKEVAPESELEVELQGRCQSEMCHLAETNGSPVESIMVPVAQLSLHPDGTDTQEEVLIATPTITE